ncbi:hypothetical protein ACLOAU_05625 [Niabella sp. CJ426]|uniref:hypothetical protein n=1 Tax=Niabella sp. CJ426 TaxID=3393740 RepID=UPI003D02FE70
MNDSIYISLGMPRHGWLPVTFRYQDFQLDFDASDVLNNPVEELYNAAFRLGNNDSRLVVWWLEPVAYLFEFEDRAGVVTLKIFEKEDWHRETSKKKLLQSITGTREILKPIRIALKEFLALKHKETDWRYDFDGK